MLEGDDAWRPVISRFGDAGDVGSRCVAVVKAVVTAVVTMARSQTAEHGVLWRGLLWRGVL